jgi:hypothetical protein
MRPDLAPALACPRQGGRLPPGRPRRPVSRAVAPVVVVAVLLVPGCGYARTGSPDALTPGAGPFPNCAALTEASEHARADFKAHPTDLTRRLREDASATLFDTGCLRR